MKQELGWSVARVLLVSPSLPTLPIKQELGWSAARVFLVCPFPQSTGARLERCSRPSRTPPPQRLIPDEKCTSEFYALFCSTRIEAPQVYWCSYVFRC
jgi:hypothetical protein